MGVLWCLRDARKGIGERNAEAYESERAEEPEHDHGPDTVRPVEGGASQHEALDPMEYGTGLRHVGGSNGTGTEFSVPRERFRHAKL
jgi:hypothetical protein